MLNRYRDTPLHLAALEQRQEVVLALIDEFGCDINVAGDLGKSLLHAWEVTSV